MVIEKPDMKDLDLSTDDRSKVETLKSQLPPKWVKLWLDKYEQVFGVRYTRQYAYDILNNYRTGHPGFALIESIAADHQSKLATL